MAASEDETSKVTTLFIKNFSEEMVFKYFHLCQQASTSFKDKETAEREQELAAMNSAIIQIIHICFTTLANQLKLINIPECNKK